MKRFGIEFDRMNGQTEFWGERGVDFDQHGLYPFLFSEVVATQVARNLIRNAYIYAPARVVNMDTKEVVLVIDERTDGGDGVGEEAMSQAADECLTRCGF